MAKPRVLLELRPDPQLLDPQFDGYKLSLEAVPSHRLELPSSKSTSSYRWLKIRQPSFGLAADLLFRCGKANICICTVEFFLHFLAIIFLLQSRTVLFQVRTSILSYTPSYLVSTINFSLMFGLRAYFILMTSGTFSLLILRGVWVFCFWINTFASFLSKSHFEVLITGR